MHEYMLGRAEDYADAPKVAAINPLSLITALDAGGGSRVPDVRCGGLEAAEVQHPSRSSLAAITDEEWDSLETDERIPEARSSMSGSTAWGSGTARRLCRFGCRIWRRGFSRTRSFSRLRATGR
jgi:hypothetical protein